MKAATAQLKTMEPAAQERTLSTLDQVVRRSCAFVTDCNGLECANELVGWIKDQSKGDSQRGGGQAPDVDMLVQKSRPHLQQKFFH